MNKISECMCVWTSVICFCSQSDSIGPAPADINNARCHFSSVMQRYISVSASDLLPALIRLCSATRDAPGTQLTVLSATSCLIVGLLVLTHIVPIMVNK